MRVGVERDGYAGMAQHLGDHLRVHILGEQDRGARVPEVVEAYLGQPRPLEQRLEAVCGDVAAVQRLADLGGEYEAVLAPQIVRLGLSPPTGAPGGS